MINMEGCIGEIRLFAGNFEPRGWFFCNGQALNIQQNTALYSILGTQYGGDGVKTFKLPKIATVLGADTKDTDDDQIHYIICVEGYYPSRR
jgi:microcystin-dependent protein